MLKYIPILLALSAFGQETVPIDPSLTPDLYVGNTAGFVTVNASHPVEIAGIDSKGHPYIVVNGTRKKCSRKQLIKFIVNSKSINDGVKRDALAYIGDPRNVQIMGVPK